MRSQITWRHLALAINFFGRWAQSTVHFFIWVEAVKGVGAWPWAASIFATQHKQEDWIIHTLVDQQQYQVSELLLLASDALESCRHGGNSSTLLSLHLVNLSWFGQTTAMGWNRTLAIHLLWPFLPQTLTRQKHAVTRIRTWVIAATTQCTNHYTITACKRLQV